MEEKEKDAKLRFADKILRIIENIPNDHLLGENIRSIKRDYEEAKNSPKKDEATLQLYLEYLVDNLNDVIDRVDKLEQKGPYFFQRLYNSIFGKDNPIFLNSSNK